MGGLLWCPSGLPAFSQCILEIISRPVIYEGGGASRAGKHSRPRPRQLWGDEVKDEISFGRELFLTTKTRL